MGGTERDVGLSEATEEPATPEAQIARLTRLLAAHDPTLAITGARLLTQGWDSLVLVVNEACIVRFARRPEIATQFVKERALLPALASTLPVAVPRFTIASIEERETPFVGYRLLPGAPLSAGRLAAYSPAEVAALARQVAAFLSALHRFPVEQAMALRVPGGDAQTWRAEYVAFYGWVRERVFPLLTQEERANVVALWEDYLADDAHFRFTPALIHRDLAVEHILHDPAHAKLTGVIDWGDTAIGDPALDFTGLLRGAGEAFTERVLAAYALPIDESLRRRARFYAAIVPFHALRFGLETGAAEHVAHGLTLLRQRIHQAG